MKKNHKLTSVHLVEDLYKKFKVKAIDGEINLHQDFKLTIASGVMFLNDGYNWTDPHPKKMIEKFRNRFPQSTKAQAMSLVVNKALSDY